MRNSIKKPDDVFVLIKSLGKTEKTYFKKYTKVHLGNNVSVGHNAIVHGCTLHDNVLIGMGSIVMDNAVVHSNTIIAAGAVVLEGTICEGGAIYAGVPAKRVKEISVEKVEGEINRIANNYLRYSKWFDSVNEASKGF